METLQYEVIMLPVTRKSDGSVTFKLASTKEVGSEDFAAIDAYRQHVGWLLFRPNQFNESDIPKEDANSDDGKRTLADTQLKSLYKLHMLRGGSSSTFHTFYRQQMQLFLDLISQKIEAEEGKK